MTPDIVGNCWHCGVDLHKYDYGREANCAGCGKSTRVCRNCRWFDPSRANQCQEPVAEEVMDKTRANYCEYFEAAARFTNSDQDADALRRAAEDLFK